MYDTLTRNSGAAEYTPNPQSTAAITDPKVLRISHAHDAPQRNSTGAKIMAASQKESNVEKS